MSRAANTQALWDEAERLNVTLVEDLHFRRDALSALEKVLARADRVYLTIDLDVLPASEMPAVSAPAALGIPALDLLPVIEQICRSGKLQAADLVEFNPQFDRDGQGTKLAARLARKLLTGGHNTIQGVTMFSRSPLPPSSPPAPFYEKVKQAISEKSPPASGGRTTAFPRRPNWWRSLALAG